MLRLLSKIKNSRQKNTKQNQKKFKVLKTKEFLSYTYDLFKQACFNMKNEIKSLPANLKTIAKRAKNLKQSNLELVEYYMANQDYSDAILRIKLLKKFGVNEFILDYNLVKSYYKIKKIEEALKIYDKSDFKTIIDNKLKEENIKLK